jgi:hypothetical protein
VEARKEKEKENSQDKEKAPYNKIGNMDEEDILQRKEIRMDQLVMRDVLNLVSRLIQFLQD